MPPQIRMSTAVYVLTPTPAAYASLSLSSADILDMDPLRRHEAITAEWTPPVAEIIPAPSGSPKLPDHPYLIAHVPCFSATAVQSLFGSLRAHGRLWPVQTPQGAFYAYQVTRVVAALDVDASSFLRYPDGNVFLITSHVFRRDPVAGATIFRMPYQHVSATYVTQQFVETVQRTQLTGFTFHQVWDGERPITGPFGGW